LHVRSTGYMFVTHMEFLILLWWSLCVGLTQEVNLSQTMPRCISPDVNCLTLSIFVSLSRDYSYRYHEKTCTWCCDWKKSCQKTRLQLRFETEIPEEDVEESDVKKLLRRHLRRFPEYDCY